MWMPAAGESAGPGDGHDPFPPPACVLRSYGMAFSPSLMAVRGSAVARANRHPGFRVVHCFVVAAFIALLVFFLTA